MSDNLDMPMEEVLEEAMAEEVAPEQPSPAQMLEQMSVGTVVQVQGGVNPIIIEKTDDDYLVKIVTQVAVVATSTPDPQKAVDAAMLLATGGAASGCQSDCGCGCDG